MVVIKDDSFLIKARIEIGQFFGVEQAEAFVELREPTTKDLLKLKKASAAQDNDEILAAFSDVLPRVILAHSFYRPKDGEKEGLKLSAAEVAELLVDRVAVYGHVVAQYLAVVFPQANSSAASSDGSPD